MAHDLYDPATAVPTSEQVLGAGNGTNFGLRFSHNTAVEIDTVWWYRKTAGHAGPNAVAIWDHTNGTKITGAAVSGDNGAVGWHAQTVPAVTLVAGRDYVASVATPGGNYLTGWASGPPTPGAGYTVVGARYSLTESGDVEPTNVSSYEAAGISVSFALAEPPTGTGEGDPVLSGDLAAWLDTRPELNKHQTYGLPWQTHQALLGLGSLIGTRTVTTFGLTLYAVVEWIATHVSQIQTAVSTVNDIVSVVRSWFSGTKPSGQDALDVILNRLDLRTEGAYANSQALRGIPPLPGDGWELQGVIDFTGAIAWDVPADAYVLTFDVDGYGYDAVDVAGVTWTPRAGWWCPLNGTQAADRRFVEFPEQELLDAGRRMPGVLIQFAHGQAGTVQAWTLAAP